MKTTNKIHYVYKITNLKPTDERLYYIGVRSTSKASAELDTNYRSSSKSLKAVIKEIGYDNFSKEILTLWNTRKEAVQEEIRLHNLFDVAKNKLYYNKSKQTSTGFDVSGTVINKDNVSVFDIIVKKQITITKLDYLNDDTTRYKRHRAITVNIYNELNELQFTSEVGLEKYCNLYDLPISAIIDSYKQGGKPMFGQSRNTSNKGFEYKGWYALRKGELRTNCSISKTVKGTIMAYDIKNKKNLRVSKEDYETNPNYVNINASKISIFDDKDNLVGCVYGGFKKYCLDNNYPYGSLYRSYQNNGSKLYQNEQYASRINEDFKGWYAVKESLR